VIHAVGDSKTLKAWMPGTSPGMTKKDFGHDEEGFQMPPRIRSLLSRPPYTREARAPAAKAPTVFREFVETLQRLDPPPAGSAAGRRRYGRRPRKEAGNGHARPRARGRTSN
jgi:hypothetical protein